jgi:hypothetical protein
VPWPLWYGHYTSNASGMSRRGQERKKANASAHPNSNAKVPECPWTVVISRQVPGICSRYGARAHSDATPCKIRGSSPNSPAAALRSAPNALPAGACGAHRSLFVVLVGTLKYGQTRFSCLTTPSPSSNHPLGDSTCGRLPVDPWQPLLGDLGRSVYGVLLVIMAGCC